MWIFWTILFSIVGIVLSFYALCEKGWHGVAGQWSTICFLVVSMLLNYNTREPEPTAIDVYRDNTELEITSVNGVPTDTVVVFKKK